MLITNVRPWGGPLAEIAVEDGRITAIDPLKSEVDTAGAVDGRGRLALPAFSDVHCHLDSTRIGLPFRPHTGSPGIWPMVMNDRENWRDAEWTVAERATHTLGRMIAQGTTRVRSYAQIDADCGLERFEGVLAAKEAHRDRCEVEVIAFPQAGLLREPGVPELIDEALASGAAVVGGIDPCTLDRDPVRHLDVLFGLAEKHQVPVDVHLHEPGELGVFSVDLILERTRALGMTGQVTISHAYALGGISESTTRRLVEEFAELDVSMATVAPAQNRSLPLTELTAAGVRVGLGQDGQRDYWSPYGNADMLDRTWQLAFTNRFREDELIEHCLAVASRGGASILDRDLPRLTSVSDRPGLAVGDQADILLVEGDTPTAAVMDRGRDRTVLHNGRVVAEGCELLGR
ncbi:Cytosine/adenosine deaminase [Saccharopolyspora antimicrobica]|uniref:Cytosine/adenosine deaminase n=1 Tax=Saccharopolyspora antimicrobica TaxID=455193 RepID=A0A1I5EKQ9_9PSEU|nr:amidohydrolase [Saccharopolyspora antimicrobica]RKT86856.1 cytosine/adenosine deaminase-related metal-dependent hydrolase [Saccharopolyspora antimicrobica]SFO11923.1 Cytosine/adenosine deaminase [Saccharopolyspora antimicrobica]